MHRTGLAEDMAEGITVSLDSEQLSREMAFGLSGYLKPLLPKESEVPEVLRRDPLLLAGEKDFCGCCRCLEP